MIIPRHGDPPLAFIESNTSGTGPLFVSAAREMGFRPVLVTANPGKYAFLSQPGAPEVLVIPRFEADLAEKALRDRFDSDIAGVTSSSEYFIPAAAGLAARFGLPGPDPVAAAKVRDKSYQRERFAGAGFPNPEFRIVESVTAALAAAREIGFPVIVKPVDETGSIGVRKCSDRAAVESHAASLFGPDPPIRRRLLVESFIDGDEFSVEVFSNRIVGITRKHLGDPPCFVETGHDYPARIPGPVARALADTVVRGTRLLDLTWGPLHWELRVHGGSAFVMEVNPRLAGGFIPELISHAQGIDLIRQTLQLVVGRPVSLAKAFRRHASIRFLRAPRAGRLLGLKGIGDAFRFPGVVDIRCYRSAGDELKIHNDFRDRIGHVIASADGFEAACSIAARAHDVIRVEVEPADDREGVPSAAA